MTDTTRLAVALAVAALLAFAPAGAAAAGAVDAQTQAQTTCEFPVTATDATGTEVTLTERPERVTTLQPSAAQTMWEIGGRDQVVGVSKYATYLDGAGERRNVSTGGFGGASIEKVVGTEPDLVLAPNSTQDGTVQSLREAGVTVFEFAEAGSVADVREKTTLIGKLTGNCEGAAEANAWITANVEAVSEATADTERPTVLYPLSGGFVVGEETFITQMIRAAGGQNVFRGEISGYREVSSEVILTSEPDVVVFGDTTASLAGQKPYRQLSAVQRNRTVTVNTNWLNQPAPRSVVYGVRNLSVGIAPSATEGVEFPARDEVTVTTETPTQTSATTEATGPATTATTEATGPATTTTSAPGLGAAVAVVAVGLAALLGRRRS